MPEITDSLKTRPRMWKPVWLQKKHWRRPRVACRARVEYGAAAAWWVCGIPYQIEPGDRWQYIEIPKTL